MTTLYEGAFAKINLTLDVLGKRADGYHDLQSVMQTISIRDDVEIDVGTGKPWRLLCSVEGIPTDEKNLAWKAAKWLLLAPCRKSWTIRALSPGSICPAKRRSPCPRSAAPETATRS